MCDVLILTDVSVGMKAKLMRISKGLRQIDVASSAHVDVIDVTRLEKERYVLPTKRMRILKALGLGDEDEESDRG